MLLLNFKIPINLVIIKKIIEDDGFIEQEQYGVYKKSKYIPINALSRKLIHKENNTKIEQTIFKYYKPIRNYISILRPLTPRNEHIFSTAIEPKTLQLPFRFIVNKKENAQIFMVHAGCIYYLCDRNYILIGSLCINKGVEEDANYVNYKETTFVLYNKLLFEKEFSLFYKKFKEYYLQNYTIMGGNVLFVNDVIETVYDCPFKIQPSSILLENVKSSIVAPIKLLLKDFNSFKPEPPSV